MATFSYFQHYPHSLLDPLLNSIKLSGFEDQTTLYSLPDTSTAEDTFLNPFLDSCNVDKIKTTTTDSSSGDHHVPSTTSAGKTRRRKTRNGSNSKEGVEGRKSKKQRNVSTSDIKEKREREEEPPKDYIHVRARRGQATDSHSLAERVRREKISERMNKLQNLVPGCDKVTGKALMLDEIINYVQSLQNQVEILSMKLASISPVVYDFGLDLDGLSAMATQTPLFPSLLDDSIIHTQAQVEEEKFVVDRSGLNNNNFCFSS